MTIQECYQVLGGDYAQVEKRLPGIHLIRKFIAKFLDDGSYPELCRAMEQGQTEEAFRAAHTLKGNASIVGETAMKQLAIDMENGVIAQKHDVYQNALDQLEDAFRKCL